VSAVSGVAGTTKEHFALSMALNLPLIVIVTKVDLASADALQDTSDQIDTYLKTVCKKIPMNINSEDDALTAASCMSSVDFAPIFYVSNVTGHGLELLYTFFNVLPPCISNRERDGLMQLEPEFQVDETFDITNVGSIVGGLLVSGIIRAGDWLRVGPLHNGEFAPVQVASVHRHKVPCRVVRAGESATLALTDNSTSAIEREVRKGMVLTTKDVISCYYFQARISVLYHAKSICAGFHATIHIGNVRQTAVVVAIMGKQGLSSNETGSVMFKFLKNPEYIHPGCRLLFREGPAKGIGHVQQVFPIDGSNPLLNLNKPEL
jgi:GTPase